MKGCIWLGTLTCWLLLVGCGVHHPEPAIAVPDEIVFYSRSTEAFPDGIKYVVSNPKTIQTITDEVNKATLHRGAVPQEQVWGYLEFQYKDGRKAVIVDLYWHRLMSMGPHPNAKYYDFSEALEQQLRQIDTKNAPPENN